MGRDLAADSDNNLWATWRHIGTHAGHVEEDDDVVIVETGSSLPTFNPVFVKCVSDDAGGLVRRTIDRVVPVVITANPSVSGLDRLRRAADETGLVERAPLPGMVLTQLDAIEPSTVEAASVDGLHVDVVDDVRQWRRYFEVLCRGFAVPPELVAPLTDPAIYAYDHIAAFLGVVDDEPVTTSLAFVDGDTAGVYNVATLPSHRNRGFGAAMTWVASLWGRSRGAKVAVLQASEMGFPIYEAMGFRLTVPYVQLVVPA